MPKDRWQELCQSVALDDGLPVRGNAGTWTEEKLYFWHRYIEITTTSMVGKPSWPEGLCYVDLFAGPGICALKNSGKRFPGSVLIAAHAAKSFRKIVAVEMDEAYANACRIRLSPFPNATVLTGDCNAVIHQVTNHLVPGALTVAFVDPEALHVGFDTIQSLVSGRRVDLLILFPDAMDIARNVVEKYLPDPQSKLDRFLGEGTNWRDAWRELGNVQGEKAREFFAKIYIRQLKTRLGYAAFDQKVMRSARGPIYRLIYACKHERGLKFWNEVVKKDVGGQTSLF